MINFDDITTALAHAIKYQKQMKEIFNGRCRSISLPQEITENIGIQILRIVTGVDARWCKETQKPNKLSGDGYIPATGFTLNLKGLKTKAKVIIKYEGIKKLEFKCFTSPGPPSFGPTEKWDMLYFLDGIDYQNYTFKMYEVPLSNDATAWKALKMSKSHTFEDQAEQIRRPRLTFDKIRKQLGDNCQLIWEGDIRNLLN